MNVTLAWDAPTKLVDDSPIPAGSVIQYKLSQVKPGVSDVVIATTQATQVPVSFDPSVGYLFYVTAQIIPFGVESGRSNTLDLTPAAIAAPVNLRVV